MAKPLRWLVLLACGGAAVGAVAVKGTPSAEVREAEAPTLAAFYAPPVESVERRPLASGQTLGGVLTRSGITGSEMNGLLLALREHLDPRRLRPTAEVAVRRWTADASPRAVEIRVNADSLIRLDREPIGWNGRVIITPTTTDTIYAEGTIQPGEALYQKLLEDDRLPLNAADRQRLAIALVNIYAFKIDFIHDIRPGDAYRVVYERDARPDGTTRRGRILTAEVVNRDRRFAAIYFDPTGADAAYYDDEGQSVQGMFRRYPLDFVRITSTFSRNRPHPILGRTRAHNGTDFGAAYGTPVRATGDGTVASAGPNGGYGNFIEIRHPSGYSTRYAHMSRFAPGIRAGRRVDRGDIIGYVGATGLATGPHLHYEFRRYGQPMNPSTVELPGGPPVPDELRDDFERVVRQRVALLERYSTGARFAAEGSGTERPAGPVE